MKRLKIGLLTLPIAAFIVAGRVPAQTDDHHTVGIIVQTARMAVSVQPVFDALAERGYIQGDLEALWAELLDRRISEQEAITVIFPLAIEEDPASLPDVVQSLVDAGVEVIFTITQAEAAAVYAITEQIPLVFAVGADPVGAGLVDSLTEPGGNVTGIASMRFHGRRLQLLVEIDPTIHRIYFAYNPERSPAVNALAEMEEVAESLDLEIVTHEFTDLAGVREATLSVPDDIDAIVISTDLENFETQIVFGWMGAANRLHVGVSAPVFAEIPGVLMAYGPNIRANMVAAAGMVDQILRGADPADMPVLNSEYALMVNMVVAESLGIDIPRGILRQAALIVRAAADETEEMEATAEVEDEE